MLGSASPFKQIARITSTYGKLAYSVFNLGCAIEALFPRMTLFTQNYFTLGRVKTCDIGKSSKIENLVRGRGYKNEEKSLYLWIGWLA